MTINSTLGLQCNVSDDGDVDVQLTSGTLQLSEEQLARSTVLASIADKPGAGLIPLSEEAFQKWYKYQEALGRQSVKDVKIVLQVCHISSCPASRAHV